MNSNFELERLLVTSPGVLKYSPKIFFEVQPNRMTPIFINIKNTLNNIKLRKIITDDLLSIIPPHTDLVCGIESGGSYFASILADKLNIPLVLYRKSDKEYAEKGRFVGQIPTGRNKVVIIDDVIVSGATIQPAIYELKRLGYQIYVHAIFSYGHDDFIKERLSVDVCSITNINNLLKVAFDEKILSAKDINFLKEFISQQKKGFVFKSIKR